MTYLFDLFAAVTAAMEEILLRRLPLTLPWVSVGMALVEALGRNEAGR